jgi:signal transduction histidine kinase
LNKKERNWIWVDWFIYLLRLFWYVSGLIYFYVHAEKLAWISYPLFAAIISLAYFIPHLFWNPCYKNAALYGATELVLIGGISIYTNIILKIDLGTAIILMSALMAGYLATKQTGLWTIPIFVILLPATRYWSLGISFDLFMQFIDILIFFGFGISLNIIINSQIKAKRILKENMKQYELIQEQNKVLEQYAAQIEGLTLLEERNRLARELHDSIGHHFTSVTVGLDAISYMIDINPKQAKQKAEALALVSRKGLNEIRHSIHQIAPSENDVLLSKQLAEIAKKFQEHTGTLVQFQTEGEEPQLSPQMKLTFIRCLQEAFTNAKRHGQATEIGATLSFTENKIMLQIENNGERFETVKHGFGLNAMKNRLEELQGNLDIQSNAENGVVVTCAIPMKGRRSI